ncbi:ABC transporter substrate-binding protein [Microbacterium tumbae]
MKKSRFASFAAGAIVVALALSSCSSSAAPEELEGDAAAGGALRVAHVGEPLTLNPFLALDNNSGQVLAQIVETLFRTTGDGEVIPWLAESATPSADFTEWAIDLQDDVLFTDGEPMTAEDVKYSIDQVRTSDGWAAMFAEITDVAVIDDTTVTITTSSPMPALEASLSLPFAAIVPKDLRGLDPEEFGSTPIGTGPFMLAEWDRGTSVLLEKNPDYWVEGLPKVDSVEIVTVTSDTNRVQQLRGGELDLVSSPPLAQVAGFEEGSGFQAGIFAQAIPDYLLLNQEGGVFSDAALREAADLAIDREAIVSAATSGVGEVGGSWIAPAVDHHDDALVPERDIAAAEDLVAGVIAAGGDPTFTLGIPAGNSFAMTAGQIIQENLQDVGFTVDVETMDGSALLGEVSAGNYDATLFGMTSDIVDPSEVVGFYIDLNGLWTGGVVEEVTSIYEQAKRAGDPAEAESLYGELQRIVAEDRSLITIDYRPWVWAMRDGVTGFDLPPIGVPWYAGVSLEG